MAEVVRGAMVETPNLQLSHFDAIDTKAGIVLEFAKIHLLDTQIGMADRMSETLASKATRLKLAMLALALAVLLTAAGIGID
jgi:hypothetical protein